MLVAVLSDTHAPRFWKKCPDRVAEQLDGVDLILHAGDVCTADVLTELQGWAPVRAVRGNNDGADIAAWGALDVQRFELAGVRVAMIHDSGWAQGRGARLTRMFPGTDLVVFGHSHIPWDRSYGPLRAFNPGSPTDRRRQPHGTMGRMEIVDGEIVSAQIVEVS